MSRFDGGRLTTRSNPTLKHRGPGTPPRRGTRQRQAQRRAGTLFWEHVLPSEVGTGPLQDLDLHRLGAVLTPQPHKLGLLIARETLALAFIDIGLGHPTTQTRLGDPEILRDLRDRLLPQ